MLSIFFLKINIELTRIRIVYTNKTIIFLGSISVKLALTKAFKIVTHDSKVKTLQTVAKPLPNNSRGKYIPLVKATSWTTILEIPDEAFSDTKLPIINPNEINIIEINTDIKIANKIYGVNGSFKIKAKAKNKIFCIKIIGIIDNIYPNI